MDNYEQDEKKFRKNIKRIFLCGMTAIVIAGGYDLIKSYTEPKKDDSSKTRIEVSTEYQDHNGAYYMAPEGYHLENVGGNICAVREVRDVIDANVQVTYSAPDGYILEGKKAVKTYYDRIELTPVETENGKVYSAPDGYTLEIIDGKVCAVRTMIDIKDATTSVNYTVPAGYTLVGNKAVRVYKEYAEPIIITEDQTSFGK